MKVRYSFSSRHNRRIKNIKKQRPKYPDLAEKIISDTNIILEVLDARFYEETRNKEIEKKIEKKGKQIVYVVNKSDLIDKQKQKQIKQKLKPSIIVSCVERKGISELRNTIKKLAKKISEKDKNFNSVNIGVIGYPNTGKSSLLNILIGKSSAGVGSDAGFTKATQKIKLSKGIILIDTPGVIPKKDYSNSEMQKIAGHAILGGRSYSQVREPEIVVQEILTKYPGVLEKYYQIEAHGDAEILIEDFGKKQGFLKKGGLVNEDAAARSIIKDWQKGKIKFGS
jgi:ribosome biogenesis GTPase A